MSTTLRNIIDAHQTGDLSDLVLTLATPDGGTTTIDLGCITRAMQADKARDAQAAADLAAERAAAEARRVAALPKLSAEQAAAVAARRAERNRNR